MMTNARTAFMTASAAKVFAVSPPCDCSEERTRGERIEVQVCWAAYCLYLRCTLVQGSNVEEFRPGHASRWRLANGLLRCRAMAQARVPAAVKDADASAILEREAGLHRNLTPRQLSMIAVGGAIGTGLFLGSALSVR